IDDDFVDADSRIVAGRFERLKELVIFQDDDAAVAIEEQVGTDNQGEQQEQPETICEPAAAAILGILLHRVLLQMVRRGGTGGSRTTPRLRSENNLPYFTGVLE